MRGKIYRCTLPKHFSARFSFNENCNSKNIITSFQSSEVYQISIFGGRGRSINLFPGNAVTFKSVFNQLFVNSFCVISFIRLSDHSIKFENSDYDWNYAM